MESSKVSRANVAEGGKDPKEMLSEERDEVTGYNRRDFTELTSEHVKEAVARDGEGDIEQLSNGPELGCL